MSLPASLLVIFAHICMTRSGKAKLKQKNATRRPKLPGCRRIMRRSAIALLLVCSACSLYIFPPVIFYSFPVQKLLEDFHLVANILNRRDKESDMIAFSCKDGWGSSLYSVYPDGSNLTLLRESPSQAHTALDWSPDGVWIAFLTRTSPYYSSWRRYWSADPRTPEIYRIRFDGSIIKRLTYNQEDEWLPKWSRDGRHIFFRSGGLRQLNANTGETKVIHDQLFWIYDVAADDKSVALAHVWDSASTGASGRRAVYQMNSDGSGLRLLKHFDWASSVSSLKWSPDGRRLLYHRYNGRPFVLDINTLEEAPAPEMRTLRATWSPNNKLITIIGEEGVYRENDDWHRTSDYEYYAPPLKNSLYVIDYEAGLVEPIFDGVSVAGPAWSPDGEWIAFARSEKPGQLVIVNPDSAEFRQLAQVDCRITDIAWSPK